MQNGKGSKRRPAAISQDQLAKNWSDINWSKEPKTPKQKKETKENE